MAYLERNLSSKINKLLDLFPVVIILGPRQCGKTTLSRDLKPDWKYFDLENTDDFDRIIRDPVFFFEQNPKNLIIDEAQVSSELFRVLRGVIDKKRQENGRFILTGSSSFELLKNISESLAGRVATVELGTFKVNEAYQVPLSKIYQLFVGPKGLPIKEILEIKSPLKSSHIFESFFWGGHPEIVVKKDIEFFNIWMDEYYSSYINRDIRALFPKLDLVRFRRFIQMIAQLTGGLINKADLARSVEVSEMTIRDYIEIAHESYIWRNYLSYEKAHIKTVLKMPKGGIRDSGLLNFLLRIGNRDQLENHPMVGRLFENFMGEEIVKGITATMATNWDYRHYRTKNKAEIDLIIDGLYGPIPIEIKYGRKILSRQLMTLKNFVEKNNLPYGFVVNNAEQIEQIAPKIIQVPAHFW